MAKPEKVCPLPSRWVEGLAKNAREVLVGGIRNGTLGDNAECVQRALDSADAERKA